MRDVIARRRTRCGNEVSKPCLTTRRAGLLQRRKSAFARICRRGHAVAWAGVRECHPTDAASWTLDPRYVLCFGLPRIKGPLLEERPLRMVHVRGSLPFAATTTGEA